MLFFCRLKMSFEGGIFDELTNDLNKKLVELNKCDNLYMNVRDLVAEFTKVIHEIEFTYFQALFVYLVVVNSLLCLTFVLDLCLRRIRKRRK